MERRTAELQQQMGAQQRQGQQPGQGDARLFEMQNQLNQALLGVVQSVNYKPQTLNPTEERRKEEAKKRATEERRKEEAKKRAVAEGKLRHMENTVKQMSPFKYHSLKSKRGPPQHMPDISERREEHADASHPGGALPGREEHADASHPGGALPASGARSPTLGAIDGPVPDMLGQQKWNPALPEPDLCTTLVNSVPDMLGQQKWNPAEMQLGPGGARPGFQGQPGQGGDLYGAQGANGLYGSISRSPAQAGGQMGQGPMGGQRPPGQDMGRMGQGGPGYGPPQGQQGQQGQQGGQQGGGYGAPPPHGQQGQQQGQQPGQPQRPPGQGQA
ncbi:hypothetical protein T484DRAFT_1765227 [Baffinella frigidus]|nr:hypothetical protein T484DRAFT_1765227 [Cryptophyta sp. CCMP2293]